MGAVKQCTEEKSNSCHFQELLKELKTYDCDTYLHSIRVAELSVLIGENVELSKMEINQLRIAAMLHDIGKTKVSLKILHNTTKLSKAEWHEIMRHPKYGVNILINYRGVYPQAIIEGVYSHHEHYNGKGYPIGIRGESIPVFARIIAVADAMDAMVNPRPYRMVPLSRDEALSEIRIHSSTQFDPYIIHKINHTN